MRGIGPPLATPFEESGSIDEERLRELVHWVEERGVDFIVPCGSNSEAELMTSTERSRVIEIVTETTETPVLAGAGHPGYYETIESIEAAADAGADAALVVTPFYYNHGQDVLEEYFLEVADASPLPVYLYSVPVFTGVRLEPETIGRLSEHPNIVGLKDSHADLGEFVRTQHAVDDPLFTMFIGSANVLTQALELGADGGILALANVAPEACAKMYRNHEVHPGRARSLNTEFVELNTAVTAHFGIPGLKHAMRARGAPAGHPRSPHRPPDDGAIAALDEILEELELVSSA